MRMGIVVSETKCSLRMGILSERVNAHTICLGGRHVTAKSGRGLSLKNWNQSALDSASRESSAQDEGLFPHIRWLGRVAGVCLCMKPRSSCGDSSRFVTGERTPWLRNLSQL